MLTQSGCGRTLSATNTCKHGAALRLRCAHRCVCCVCCVWGVGGGGWRSLMPTERCFPPAKTAKGPVAGVRTGRTAETLFGQLAQPGFFQFQDRRADCEATFEGRGCRAVSRLRPRLSAPSLGRLSLPGSSSRSYLRKRARSSSYVFQPRRSNSLPVNLVAAATAS